MRIMLIRTYGEYLRSFFFTHEYYPQRNVEDESPCNPSQHNDGGTGQDDGHNLMRIEPFPIVRCNGSAPK